MCVLIVCRTTRRDRAVRRTAEWCEGAIHVAQCMGQFWSALATHPFKPHTMPLIDNINGGPDACRATRLL